MKKKSLLPGLGLGDLSGDLLASDLGREPAPLQLVSRKLLQDLGDAPAFQACQRFEPVADRPGKRDMHPALVAHSAKNGRCVAPSKEAKRQSMAMGHQLLDTRPQNGHLHPMPKKAHDPYKAKRHRFYADPSIA